MFAAGRKIRQAVHATVQNGADPGAAAVAGRCTAGTTHPSAAGNAASAAVAHLQAGGGERRRNGTPPRNRRNGRQVIQADPSSNPGGTQAGPAG